MPKKLTLSYSINNAEIDIENIEDDEIKAAALKMKELVEANDYDGANKAAPKIDFEFNAENMDSGWEDYLVNPHVNFTINNEDDLFLRVEDDALKLDVLCQFEIEIKDGVKPEKFQQWLDDDGGWMACTAASDWSYLEDEGGNLFALGVKRKPKK